MPYAFLFRNPANERHVALESELPMLIARHLSVGIALGNFPKEHVGLNVFPKTPDSQKVLVMVRVEPHPALLKNLDEHCEYLRAGIREILTGSTQGLVECGQLRVLAWGGTVNTSAERRLEI